MLLLLTAGIKSGLGTSFSIFRHPRDGETGEDASPFTEAPHILRAPCAPESQGSARRIWSAGRAWSPSAHVGNRISAGHIRSKNGKTTTEPRIYFYAPLTGEECVTFSKGGAKLPKLTVWFGSHRQVKLLRQRIQKHRQKYHGLLGQILINLPNI
jgi:hypothetical protein